jgi:hypothetical protein
MRNSRWVRLLAYVTGSVNQELLLRNEYLAAENHILRTKFPARLRLSDPERITLAEIGKRLSPRPDSSDSNATQWPLGENRPSSSLKAVFRNGNGFRSPSSVCKGCKPG